MTFQSKYIAKHPDANGFIRYDDIENETWKILFNRQSEIVKNRACNDFIAGLKTLNMHANQIPQCPEMNAAFARCTGWKVKPVETLISADEFFTLLSEKTFPAAAFIRCREELDYLQEPDIFHEFFGHCPLLTVPGYAEFMHEYGKIALKANPVDRDYLARFYWHTIEFGLIQTLQGLRIYGGGILSSKEETIYAVESPTPKRLAMGSGLDALRTSYRIDILQPVYFVIENYSDIYHIMHHDIIGLIHKAQDLGDHPPLFEPAAVDHSIVKC